MKPLIIPKKQSIPPTSEPRLAYSIAEVAKLLGCSERSLRVWIKSGQIHTRKIGGRVFVPAESLHKLFADSAPSDK